MFSAQSDISLSKQNKKSRGVSDRSLVLKRNCK